MVKNTKISGEFKLLQNEIVNLTKDSRARYYTRISNKINDSHVSPKAYWLILKMLWNNKKIPIIPPLFYENRFVIDFTKKLELFNSFFASHWTTAVFLRLSSCLKGYVPLLPICGKIFERLLYKKIFNLFITRYLISAN